MAKKAQTPMDFVLDRIRGENARFNAAISAIALMALIPAFIVFWIQDNKLALVAFIGIVGSGYLTHKHGKGIREKKGSSK